MSNKVSNTNIIVSLIDNADESAIKTSIDLYTLECSPIDDRVTIHVDKTINFKSFSISLCSIVDLTPDENGIYKVDYIDQNKENTYVLMVNRLNGVTYKHEHEFVEPCVVSDTELCSMSSFHEMILSSKLGNLSECTVNNILSQTLVAESA